MKRLFCCWLILVLLSTFVPCALADDMLMLPLDLKTIEAEAFVNADSIVYVYAQEGLERIEERAFANTSLLWIHLPASVTYIADNAFEGCVDVNIDADMETYAYAWAVRNGYLEGFADDYWYRVNDGAAMITHYTGNDSEIIVPAEIDGYPVRYIDSYTFFENQTAVSVVIPQSVVSIGEWVFYGCPLLTSVYVPDSVEEIGAYAIYADNVGIVGVPGSAAETFATEYEIPFTPDVSLSIYPWCADFALNEQVKLWAVPGEVLSFSGTVHSSTIALESVQIAIAPAGDPAQGNVIVSKDGIATDTVDLSSLGTMTVGQTYGNLTMAVGGVYDIWLYVNDGNGGFRPISSVRLIVREEGEEVTYRALLIGQTYEGNSAGISVLESCGRDVDGMKSMLGKMTDTPYTVTVKKNLTVDGMKSSIASAFGAAKDTDVSLFYYSGHGASSNSASYMGALVDIDGYCLTVADLKAALDKIPGKKIVMLDSCHSGAHIGKSTDAPASAAEQFNQSVISVFSSGASPKSLAESGYYVITASHSSEYSWGGEYGVFTKYVLEGSGLWKSSGAMPADNSGDSRIGLDECYDYAYSRALSDTLVYSEGQHAQVYPENCDFILWAK